MRPSWLKTPLDGGDTGTRVRDLLKRLHLNTVCAEARCPNRGECHGRCTAAFLILGRTCTRDCAYCAVDHGIPRAPDPEEGRRIAIAARLMGLRYVVVTSVTRDDLPLGGAGMFRSTALALRRRVPGIRIELLTPDFRGELRALETVAEALPDVLNHNVETVQRLFPSLRPSGNYLLSLEVLREFQRLCPEVPTKSGLMLGLGETETDVWKTLEDLREAGVSMVTLGQYLQPSFRHREVARYVTPEEFQAWRDRALGLGFRSAASGPLVRSSYHADLHAASLL